MAKVLSDRTAEWLKNQINSRDLTSKSRKGVILGGGGGGSNSFLAKITRKNNDGSFEARLLPQGKGGPPGDYITVWMNATPVTGGISLSVGSLVVVSAVPAQMAQVEISEEE